MSFRTKLLTSERERAPWLLFDFLWQLHPASKKYYTAVETMNSVVRRVPQRIAVTLREFEQAFVRSIVAVLWYPFR